MTKIKIISDKADAAKPKHVPKSHDLSATVDRFRAPGGKPPLPFTKSYNKQGK